MKKAVKYIVLVLGAIGALILSLVFFSFLEDFKLAGCDALLLLPMIAVALFIATIISIIVLSFKFSNEKKLKTPLIVTVILLLFAIAFLFLGRTFTHSTPSGNTVATTTKKHTEIDKDVFINRFLSESDGIEANLTRTTDGDTNDEYKFLVYDMLDTRTLDYSDLYIMYDTESNKLKSVAFTSTPDDALIVAKSIYLVADILKDGTPNITEKCGVAPYVHTESITETEYMTMIKTLEGNTFTLQVVLH